VTAPQRLLVFADSLAFHGPERAERPSTPELFPNICAHALGANVQVDLVARLGYTARDGWWALTKDPVVWGTYLPRATAVVIAQGQYDQLPAAIPTWLRESIPFIRPGSVRRQVRQAYLRVSPTLIRATGARMTQLSPVVTNHYLTRMVEGIRYMRPGLPIVRLLAAPYESGLYPSNRPHIAAAAAGRNWCDQMSVIAVDTDPLVTRKTDNPDGLHFGWDSHRLIGEATAAALVSAGFPIQDQVPA